MAHILIIDDDPIFGDHLLEHCLLLGHEANGATSIEEGKAKLAAQPMDLVFLDVRLPDGNGLDCLPYIHSLSSAPEVIIVTGMADANGAELAINNGAWDYLQKPLGRQEIILHIHRALEYHDKKAQCASRQNLKRDEIIGESKPIRACLDQVASCSATDTGVLITGETGTGKEQFARAIHANSRCAGGPFVVVDCASLPDQLVTSILFGHVKGAFTGADSDRHGLIDQASGGTLFLDETGELPLEVQKNFLRVLQEQVFRPVGKRQEVKSDFRLVAATHRNLEDMVSKGQFRQDLYYRLNSFAMHLPPLRDRGKDIEKLALSFAIAICRKQGLPIKGILPETLETLNAYSWPGNVRELYNVLEQAILADLNNPVLYPVHLPPAIRLHRIRSMVSSKHEDLVTDQPQAQLPSPGTNAILPYKEHRRLLLQDMEKQYLQRLLQATEGDIAASCAIAQFSRSHLYNLMRLHSLASPSPSCREKKVSAEQDGVPKG